MSIKGNSIGSPVPDPRNGLAMKGNISMGGNKILDLAAPADDSHATNKQYVDESAKELKKYVDGGFRQSDWLPTPEDIGAEPAGATRTKRLWANASPGSTFPPQTILQELSEGDWVEITYKAATNGTVHTTERVRVGENILLIAYANATSSSPVSVYTRRANTTAAGVEFEKGTSKVITDGDTFGNDNAKVIPLYIHVIKGVQK